MTWSNTPTTYPPTQPKPNQWGWAAVASLVMGVLNLFAWLLPICGGPLAFVGIIVGALGLKSSRRGLAIAGMVLSGLGLLLSMGNALLGAYLGWKSVQSQQQPVPIVQSVTEPQPSDVQQGRDATKPRPVPQTAPQSAANGSVGGSALNVRYSTSPATPLKGHPFHFNLEVSNLTGKEVTLCAVNFRGDITSVYDALISPAGDNYWTSGSRFQEGAILTPCKTIGPGATQTIVFGMTSHVNATWSGEVGICPVAPSEGNLQVLDKCIYVPVSVSVTGR